MDLSTGESVAPGLEHLIVVAGHAVYVGGSASDPEDEASWCLDAFQRGEPRLLIEHIRHGVRLASQDDRSLLVFSGGMTRREAGERSEARGYRDVAEHFRWWSSTSVARRTMCEEFARDSFENLLFGIARFREATATYPTRITVVGWKFKRARFDLHRAAIRFPASAFTYAGVNDPVALEIARAGEARTREVFEKDPYGSSVSVAEKRTRRNPFEREPPYAVQCPEIRGLLQHGGAELFAGALPWN